MSASFLFERLILVWAPCLSATFQHKRHMSDWAPHVSLSATCHFERCPVVCSFPFPLFHGSVLQHAGLTRSPLCKCLFYTAPIGMFSQASCFTRQYVFSKLLRVLGSSTCFTNVMCLKSTMLFARPCVCKAPWFKAPWFVSCAMCLQSAKFFRPHGLFLRYVFTKRHVLEPHGLFLAPCVYKAPCSKAPWFVPCAMCL